MKPRSVLRPLALAFGCLAFLTGCSSAGGPKTSAANSPASAQTQAGAAFARLDPATFAERMKDQGATVINVHIPYEGEIERTDAFIPFDKILDDSRLPKDRNSEILLYCRTGRMSEEAGNALHKAGYTNLSHLEGGMRAWEAAGRKLIQNPANASSDTSSPMQHS